LDDIRRALRISHTLWGGRYNPLIPVGDATFAKQLVEVFRVDVLYPSSEDRDLDGFVRSFPHLPWPHLHRDFFVAGSRGKRATFLDIQHPVRHLYEEYVKKVASPTVSAVLFEWDPNDPLADVLLANFGSYPSPDESGLDYGKLLERHLSGQKIALTTRDPVKEDAYKLLTPSRLTEYLLLRDRSPGWDIPGVYVGSASNFSDIVNLWNLRAADIDLIFYDLAYAERLRPLRDAYLAALRKRPPIRPTWRDGISIWSKSRHDDFDVSQFGPHVLRHHAEPSIWNGLNITPPLMHFTGKSVLGSVTDDDSTPTLSFQLPDKPFLDEVQFHLQHVVVSIDPLLDISKNEQWTWKTPYVPELNEYYGREYHFVWSEARAELDGLGIITELTRDHLTLRGLSRQSLIQKIFEVAGIKAEPSQPGLVARRLIQQMGGVQGCRVFKIAGVRRLIGKYSPSQSFVRSAAIQIIGENDPQTGKPNFEAYESLCIEPRSDGRLRPEDAFTYLVKRGVFRVGLKFACPNCNLDFWLSLDDVATQVACEYCGNDFNVTPQLRDRDWAYRRSGLFGRDDHQQGAIPVALTLQQLDTTLSMRSMIYVTGLELKPGTAAIDSCEMDLTVITQGFDGRVQVTIGECKAGGEISERDVENLRKVADAFPRNRFDVFIILSKTTPFTPDEVARCRLAQEPYRDRVILLSGRELEPYFVYELAEKEFEIDRSAIALEDLAKTTHNIYFEPRPKGTSSLHR